MKIKDLKNLVKLLWHYKWLVIFNIFFSMVVAITTLIIPILVGNAIDCMVEFNKVFFEDIFYYIGLIIILTGVTFILKLIISILVNKMIINIENDLRGKTFNKIHSLSVSYFDRVQSGNIINLIVNDINNLKNGLQVTLMNTFSGVTTILGILFYILYVNYKIALIIILMTPFSFFITKYITNKTHKYFKKQLSNLDDVTNFVNESIVNIKVIKNFNNEKETIIKLKEKNKQLKKTSIKAIFYSSLTNPAIRFLNNITYVLVGGVGALAVVYQKISLGNLTCFLTYAKEYAKPFNELSGVITELQSALVSLERINCFLLEKDEYDIAKNELVVNSGDITLENVNFSYVNNIKILKNINLDIKSGKRVAIIGPTGSGKTTLVNLIMRFYDIDNGRLLIDNNNIYNYSRSSLRKNIGMIFQEVWLKEGTVKENIKFGNSGISDQVMDKIVKETGFEHVISRLPKGYNTVINADTNLLSEGEKQLLCIIRIMLNVPTILILDEATSKIDVITERKIIDCLEKLMESRTSIIVAHRLSTLKNTDLILRMKDGVIVEKTTYQELLKNKEIYNTE